MERARGAQAKAGLSALPDELLTRVLVHLPSICDFGRADGVCRAWRARGSPVEQALRERIEARGGALCADSTTQRMCWLELLREARAASGRLSASSDASAAVDERGRLRVWGALEDPDGDEQYFSFDGPTILPTLHGTRVERVSVGEWHAIMLSDTGEVLSFGWGVYGMLGHGDEEDQLVPKVIEALRGTRVVAITAGDVHSMVLTDEGEVLSFGHGFGGRLGHGDQADQFEPKVIEALRGVRVVAIAASSSHSMVLTDAGKVLSFGYGRYGQLGHGDEKRVQRLVPRVIEGLQANGRLVASLRDPAA